jgi:mannose/cellobiose epimerase-like protein (N-acyl-D-glucosamine 2-epimerase family)
MKRRTFFGAATGAGALAAGVSPACSPSPATHPRITDIGGLSLDEVYSELHTELFDIFLPLMERAVIDNEYGGFMCQAHPDESRVNTDKRTWYQGRGVWVYSFLYRMMDKNRRYLEIAKKGVEFILKTMPPEDTFWAEWYTREGKPLGGPDPVLYSDLFMAEGLQEYAAASGDFSHFDLARKILFKMVHIYDNRPGYGAQPKIGDKEALPCARILGHWMLLLRLATQMLAKRPDPEIEALAERCMDMIMNRHWNPEFRLFTEYLNHDLSRITGGYGQWVLGHGQEAMWMVMERALVKKDKKLFDLCAGRLLRQCEVFWDDVYGGELLELVDVDKNIWDTRKALWLHDEICIGTMMAVEHRNAAWAKEWFARCFTYIREKLDNRNHGFKGWKVFPDRKATFDPAYDRIENFHHPRQLMLNMLALDRIRKRSGRTSVVFE